MRTVSIRLVSVVCIALLSAPAPALAKKRTHAPPGNSGVDEYVEVVPGGGGNRPTPRLKPGSGRTLSGKARNQLRSYGRDGQAVANLANRTADPSSSKRSRKHAVSARALGTEASSANNGDSGVFAALKRVAAIGTGFPVLLLAVLAAGAAFALHRRRRSSQA